MMSACGEKSYQSDDLIALGSAVVLRKLIKGRRFYYKQETVRDCKTALKGCQFNLVDAIGQPYGTLFRIDGQRMLPVEDASEFDQFEGQVVSDLTGTEAECGDKDNRNIVDTSDNQKLKESDLTGLKQSGESGRHVIQQLIGNSTSFEQKTAFSQEYVRKKKEKYLEYVSVLRPSARVLSELRGRGLNLRIDMLSQLLAYANVHYESRVLLIDDSPNQLLTHAVCERLTEAGRLCLLSGANQNDLYDRILASLSERHSHLRLHAVQLSMVGSVLANRQSAASGQLSVAGSSGSEAAAASGQLSVAEAASSTDLLPPAKRLKSDAAADSVADAAKAQKRAELLERQLSDQKVLGSCSWDCLLVASKYSPLSLAPLLQLLLPGRPFAFYSPHQDALVSLALHLKSKGQLLTPVLFDSFLRKYQIMPNRCRPHLKMIASSGFALTGRVCFDGPPVPDCDDADA